MLAFLSRHSVDAAGYLHKELALAFDVVQQQPEGAIFLIPIRLGGSQVPERFRNLHWLDVQAIEGPIGSTYLRLRRSLLRRALQIGLLEGVTRTTRRRLSGVSKVNCLLDDTIKGGRWEPKQGLSLGPRELGIVVSGHYLVRGQNADGTRYYGVAEISQSEESLVLQAKIGVHVLKYVGRLDGAVFAFTGAHDVEYSVERGGSLVGRWGDTGFEELIPASPFASRTGD